MGAGCPGGQQRFGLPEAGAGGRVGLAERVPAGRGLLPSGRVGAVAQAALFGPALEQHRSGLRATVGGPAGRLQPGQQRIAVASGSLSLAVARRADTRSARSAAAGRPTAYSTGQPVSSPARLIAASPSAMAWKASWSRPSHSASSACAWASGQLNWASNISWPAAAASSCACWSRRRALVGGPQAQTLLEHGTAYYAVVSLIWSAAIIDVFGLLAAVRFSRR